MPNTTNYSFPTPADTDLVKNGADAIRDLGDAVDTAMNTALGTKKSGLVLLNTTSFSGVASVSLPAATFSATYKNYVIKINHVGTGDVTFKMRMRVSGSDNSSSQYNAVGFYHTSANGTVNPQTYAAQNFWWIGEVRNGFQGSNTINLSRPFETAYTTYHQHMVYGGGTTTGEVLSAGSLTVTTSYDSASFIPDSGNFTGTVSVYGVNE